MSGSGVQRELTRNKKVEVAIANEYLTRQRVAHLEATIGLIRPYIFPESSQPGGIRMLTLFEQMEPLRRGFWGRLRWLVTGR